ncbi:heterokaryon incompatibility protein-domain-containing protein [Suillus plorans]|uniref:Heterokaryon incompatibility protein-domain-containing protein n=1 Tax=Suillus plorans TaxID=116603 RepID=A0A9P7A8S3_9AGAM|nr:heterokaryon incompatibility protein-domain-containing protein [Suillus plorans]KAG1784615.1 heterokaryon incompatibility protein-domain-containing protein [Suillus plorans]
MAILLYSRAIELDPTNETIFVNCSKAKLKQALWEEALVDAKKVIELDPSYYIGYQLKHEAFHGAQRYDEAIETFQIMLSKLDNAPETQIRKLRQQYLSPPEADGAIRKSIHIQMENAPLRLLNTSTGYLCDRDAQIASFKSSTRYKELLLLTMKHKDLRMERIKKSVTMYFRCVMLSHRWEEKEPLLYDIQEKVVYKLNPVGGIVKLQSFCKVARKAGYRWAWVDTCCIDQNNNVELQKSLNSMFSWYRQSSLTIIYLSDVPPLSKSGALAKSAWNTRGWTVPEFLAPKVLLFYQSDWTIYLDDPSSNHKESVAIMQELGDATGIDSQALVAFRPGMRGAREKLRWASTRTTTLQEDIAYSLFGIFGVHLPVIYGEMKENALGRLLQEIVGRSGDITALDWVGISSDFNSCLPANITSYEAPPCVLPSLSEDDIQASVSSLRSAGVVELALRIYNTLDNLSAPRFSHRRLHLPCIAFPIVEVRRRQGQDQETPVYEVKTDGLADLLITTEDRLIPFSSTRPLAPWQTFLLVRPWNRGLLELPNPPDDMQNMKILAAPSSPSLDSLAFSFGENEPVDIDSHSRALRLIVRLGQPFSAFLLARQHSGEYKRIASNRDIVAQVKDMTSVHDIIDIRTLEIS